MSNVIGSNLEKLKEVAEKCKREEGTLAIRTKFVGLDDNQIRVMCYGGDNLPTGIIDEIAKEKIEKLRREIELKGKDAFSVIKNL